MSNDVTVRLKGDKRDLDKALDQSRKSVTDYAGAVKAALAGIAAALAIRQVASFGSSMLELYNTQIAAETKLESVLRATGHAAGYTSSQLKQIASDMQNEIGVGDELILNTQAIIATFRNIRGDTFVEATKAAYDMAAVLGGDASSNALQLGKALNDPVAGISALSRAGVTFSQTQKDMIASLVETGDVAGAQRVILDELAQEFGGAAADKAGTFEGAMTRVWNRLGDVGEKIGEMVAGIVSLLIPAFDVAVGAIEGIVGALDASALSNEEWANSWQEYFIGMLKTGAEIAADAFSWLEFLFTNFGAIVERTTYSWMLTMVSSFEELKYWFTSVIPEYLNWFANNFTNILTDIATFESVVFMNMLENFGNFFETVKSWLSGDPKDFEWVSLTKGFESSLEALPEIAERQLSDTEKFLMGSIKQMDTHIGNSMAGIFDKNKKFVDGLFNKKDDPVKPKIVPDFEPAVIEGKKAAEKVEKSSKDAASKIKDEVAKIPSNLGSTTGIEALASDLQSAAIKGAIQDANNSDVAARSFEFNGKGKAELGAAGDKDAGKNDAMGAAIKGAIKDANDADIANRSFELNGKGKAELGADSSKEQAKETKDAVVGAVNTSAEKTTTTLADAIKVLMEIRDQHPATLKALGLVGGVV